MRVLMVSDVYFPRVNGVSTSIETFRRALPAEGVTVDLLVPRYGEEPDEPGISRIAGWRIPSDPEDRLVNWRAMNRHLQTQAGQYDLIHLQTPFVAFYAGLAAARRQGLPVVTTYHTLFEEYLQHYAAFLPANWLRRQARGWSQRQCNAVDTVIVPSHAMQHRLADYGVTQPMEILPTGIPLAQFHGGDGRAFRLQHGILSTRPLALFVGRIAHEKNIGFLLEAVAQARRSRPDILFLIAGEGPAVDDLKTQIKALGLRDHVQFVGYMDRVSTLAGCYAAADIFIFASRTETQGLVLLEAMAAGLPVIALSAMGTTDILAAGRGCRVAPDNPVTFGNTVADFLNKPSAWRHLAEEAPLYASEWSDQAMAGRLASLYRRLKMNHASPATQAHNLVTTP